MGVKTSGSFSEVYDEELAISPDGIGRRRGGHGKLLWYALGAKTIKLIHENIHVEAVRDDLDTLVMDADVLAEILELQDPRKSQELELKVITRLRKHKDIPRFIELGRRLEAVKGTT